MNGVIMKIKGIEFTEVVDVLDVIDCHDQDVEIRGWDDEGVEWSAVATESCGEIVDIYEDTIEYIG